MDSLGADSFRHALAGTMLRSTLYFKNAGHVSVDQVGLLRTDSPVSGNMLLSHGGTRTGVKDPITGTRLELHGHRAVVTTPVQQQQLVRSRKFYLTRDVDITLQTLRNTTKFSRYTNEKVGTAGTPTGMDESLRNYRTLQLQQQQRLREQQLELEQQ